MKNINKKFIITFAAIVILLLSALVARAILENPVIAGDKDIVADTGLFEADEEAKTTEIKNAEAISTEALLTEAASTVTVNTEAVSKIAAGTAAVSTEAISTEALHTEAASTVAVSTEAVSTVAAGTAAVSTEAISTEALLVETETSREHALSESSTIRDTVVCNGVTVPLTESINVVTDDKHVQESRWQVTEWEEHSVFSMQAAENRAKTGMIDPDAALNLVLEDIELRTPEHAVAESVNIVLVNFADLYLISQTEISKHNPTEDLTYLITIKKIEAFRRTSQVRNNNEPRITAISTFHYMVDAYSADLHLRMAYGDTE